MIIQTRTSAPHYRSTGAALIISLILLSLVTLVAMTGVETVGLQEKMAVSSYDRIVTMQAAETALREGEALAETQSKTTPPNTGFPNGGLYTDVDTTCPNTALNDCQDGLCRKPDKDCDERWTTTNFTGWRDSSVDLGELAGTPQFFVEYLGGTYACVDGSSNDPNNCKRYRVTVLSNPGDGRAEVILQSVYATD
jgi:type IV pilus assembly protein PilX